MQSVTVGTRFSITQVGDFASRCLQPGQQGSVLASFSSAVYLVTEDGGLFWLAGDVTPMHRRATLINGPLSKPAKGAEFVVVGDQLRIDSMTIVGVTEPTLWQAPAINPIDRPNPDLLTKRIHSFIARLNLSGAKGFGVLIPSIQSLFRQGSPDPRLESADPVLQYASKFIQGLSVAYRQGNATQISQNTKPLIGLGFGLTPSGDDFLGGLLFAIHSLKAAYPHSDFSDLDIPLEPYCSRTNLISFSILDDLARGHGPEPLHQLINGLLSAEPPKTMDLFASQLTLIGASTGWDLLAGFLTGMLLICRRQHSPILA